MPPDVRKAYGFPTCIFFSEAPPQTAKGETYLPDKLKDNIGKAEPFPTSGRAEPHKPAVLRRNSMHTFQQPEFGDHFANSLTALLLNRHQRQAEVFFQQTHHGHSSLDRSGA